MQAQFEKGDPRARQAALEALLGISFESYSRTYILGTQNTQSFAAASPDDRRALLEVRVVFSISWPSSKKLSLP